MSTTEGAVTHDEDEVRAAHAAYIATRERILAGEVPWSALADHFVDESVYIDPAWGRVEGLDAMIRFFDESMAGLEDWSFPEVWTMVDGDRVVSSWWNRLPGVRDDGSPLQALGISVMYYAGDGKFRYSCDLLNMVEVGELIAASGWTPTGEFHMPPTHPDRDISLPDGSAPR